MSLDIPEVLILALTALGFVWAVYNWTHPHPHVKR
jgi:hypothetical protein